MKEKRGLRGKIVEKKKEEMSDYMEKAVALVHSYVPPQESPQDAVNLNVRFVTLADETIYPADVMLEAKAKEIKVNVQNSDYRIAGN